MTAPCNIVPTSLRRVRAAVLSAVLPGLGQLTQGRRLQALTYFAITLLLIALSLGLGRISGPAAEVFFFMLLALPWWAIQSYDAYLGPSDSSADLRRTCGRSGQELTTFDSWAHSFCSAPSTTRSSS